MLLIAGLVAVSIGSGAHAVGARQTQPDAALSLAAPRDTPVIAGQLVVVDVSVTSQRALRGVVVVSTSTFDFGGSTVYRVPVELAAGTPVEFPLAVISSFGGIEIDADLVVDGEVVAEGELRRFTDEAAGVLAAVLGIEAPESLDLAAGGGSAATFEITGATLETVGLPNASYLIASSSALASLTEAALRSVVAWVSDGGQLVVVGAEGSADQVLPTDWSTGAGLGSVDYVDGDWAEYGLPLPARTVAGGPGQIDPQMLIGDVSGSPIDDLAADAGFRLPSLRSLLILLGAYALLAGPITYLILKRRSSTHRAWLVLPALAVLFTGIALVVGAGLRSDRGSAYASVVEVWPSGSKATTTILISSARSDVRTVTAPQAWHYTGSGQLVGWGPVGNGAVSVEPGRTGVAVSSNLTAGGAVSMQLSGPAPQFDGALTIDDVVLDGNVVAARVTNSSGSDLVKVVAILGSNAVEVGDLADGESRSFTIEHSSRVRQRFAELNEWGINQFGAPPQRGADVAAGFWTQWRSTEGLNAFPDGFVGVVGWSADLAAPASDISSGRTALVARAALPLSTVVGSPLPSVVVADPAAPGNGFQDAFFFGWSFVTRVDAGDLDASQIAVDVQAAVAGLEMWTGEDWIPVELDERGDVSVGVLPDALIDGSVYLRSTVVEGWPIRPGVGAHVGEADVPDTREVGDVLSRWEGGFVDQGPGGFAELSESTEVELTEGDQTFEGDLFGAEYDEYRVVLADGDQLSIRLRADHDSLLIVLDPEGRQFVENDDFQGVCCHSGADLSISEAGEYVIEARALGGNGSGDYELVIDFTPDDDNDEAEAEADADAEPEGADSGVEQGVDP